MRITCSKVAVGLAEIRTESCCETVELVSVGSGKAVGFITVIFR
jgi:hypothetical protein